MSAWLTLVPVTPMLPVPTLLIALIAHVCQVGVAMGLHPQQDKDAMVIFLRFDE